MDKSPEDRIVTRVAGAAERVANAMHANDGLGALVQSVKDAFRAQTAAIILLNERSHQLHICASRGLSPQFAAQYKRPLGTGIIAEAVLGGMTLVISDAAANPEEASELRLESEVGCAMIAPIAINHRPAGYLYCDHRQPGKFQRDDLRAFQALSFVAALAVEKADMQEKISRLAVEDPVTGLFTYAHFLNRLTNEIARAVRYGENCAVLVVSVQNLAQTAQAHGEGAAGEVLRAVGAAVKENIRAVDFAARMAHEQIVVCLVHADEEGLYVVSERLCALAGRCRIPSRAEREAASALPHEPVATEEVAVGLYLAGAVAPEHGRDSGALISNLQTALLAAKAQGTGALVMYEP